MDRQTLDMRYLASRSSPARVFKRAASENPLQADTYGFLLAHVDELEVDDLIILFNAQRADDVNLEEKPFVRRLAEVAPTAGVSRLLGVLRLSTKISPEAWVEDLTLPLRGRLPNYQWYRFVDKARGGNLFNALNVGIPRHPDDVSWDPDEIFVTSIEELREEPLVVALLERPHDDLAAAEFVLSTRPVVVLLQLLAQFPNLVRLDDVKSVLPSRVASTAESWALLEGMPPLPTWMAPFVVDRLHHCGDEEARSLYEWLCSQPEGSHDGDAYALALERFKRAPFERFWHPRIGRHLSTGASWKTRGREFIDLCIDLELGFPREALHAAFEAAEEKDGATAEKHQQSILRKIHDETAKLLVDRATRALNAGNHDAADLHLSALLSLEPGSFIGGALHQLRKIPDLPPGIVARAVACEKLAGAGGRDRSEDAFYEAFRVLTGQLS